MSKTTSSKESTMKTTTDQVQTITKISTEIMNRFDAYKAMGLSTDEIKQRIAAELDGWTKGVKA
jgi:hypothetical protein